MSVKYRLFEMDRDGRSEVPFYHFIRDFCLWKMIHEIGVINSGVKSRVH